MNDGASIRPSWWYLSVGVALAADDCGLFVYFVWNGLAHMTDPVTQVVVPGEADLKLTRPGRYTVFLEEQSVVNGRIFSNAKPIVGLKCSVRQNNAGGGDILMRKASSSISYSLSGRSGRSVMEFSIREAGGVSVRMRI